MITSHVLSLSGVAQELARRNHEVSFVSFDENKKHATNLSFASLGPVPKPASAYGNCQNIFGFLREINDYSVAALPVLAARFSSSASRPDVIAIDCTYPVAIPFCDSIPCVCLIANDVGLPMLGSNSDLKPCMISGLSSSDLRASFVARLKDFVLTRVLRWNNNKVTGHHVEVEGNLNTIHGCFAQVKGNMNKVFGHAATVKGNLNKIEGRDCKSSGNGNKTKS